MKKIGIFYGSSTGTTENIARKLARIMGVPEVDVRNVAKAAPSAVADYDMLVLGSSTWGNGELQDDWYDFLTGLEALDLRGKTVAIFGCGDQTMNETFCNAVGEIYDRLQSTGATFSGKYDTLGYNFDHSRAVKESGGEAVGLLLDEVNHPEYTDRRLRGWVAALG